MKNRRQALAALCLLTALPAAGHAELAYTDSLPADAAAGGWVIDTRPQARCLAESLAGTHCLPPEALFGPHRRLASIRDIAWVFGTLGLRGDETVTVVGDDPQRRDVVAALLHLAGQAQVQVVTTALDRLLADPARPHAGGRARGMVRAPIYQARAREQQWLLRNDVSAALLQDRPPRVLDGRSSPAYWGEIIRGRRGGHLPGAELASGQELRSALRAGRRELAATGSVIAYAHDAYSGLAYLTLLRAGMGVDARLYVRGWREWADDARLPVEAATYPEQTGSSSQAVARQRPWLQSLLVGTAVLAAAATGFMFGRRTI
jgi:thiosulfate/3-mercaptopyruvate sulfurtransferase